MNNIDRIKEVMFGGSLWGNFLLHDIPFNHTNTIPFDKYYSNVEVPNKS